MEGEPPIGISIDHASGIKLERGQSSFIKWIKRRRHSLNAFLSRFSLVGDTPTYDLTHFPWIAKILEVVPQIREEAEGILRHTAAIPPFRDFAPGHERIAPSANDWRSFFFYGYGYPVQENLDRCPVVADAVKDVPGLVSAIYSVVGPGAHIRRHRGVSKAIMTAHIGLIVPDNPEACRMDVDGNTVIWRMGEAVVFDDTYHHEVWNETDQTRVLLLIQFRRPMRQPGKLLADMLVGFVRHSSFVQRARRNLAYWEEAFARAERGEEISLT